MSEFIRSTSTRNKNELKQIFYFICFAEFSQIKLRRNKSREKSNYFHFELFPMIRFQEKIFCFSRRRISKFENQNDFISSW